MSYHSQLDAETRLAREASDADDEGAETEMENAMSGSCTAHHPVYGSCLCDKPKFHTGEHSTLYREKGAKYSHRFNWPQEQKEFLDTLADNTAELDQMEREEFEPTHPQTKLRRVRLSEIAPDGLE